MPEHKIARTVLELYEAHDLLSAILRGDIKGMFFSKGQAEDCAFAARNTLCWVLGHGGEHGSDMVENLKVLREAVAEAGYKQVLKQ